MTARSVVFWPSLTVLGLLLILGVAGAYNPVGSLFLLPMLAFIALVVGIFCVAFAVIQIKQTRFSRAASYLVFPLVAAAFVLAPRDLLRPFVWFGTLLRFELNRNIYESMIAQLPHPVGKRFTAFDWSGFAGNNTFLIFDESDALAREEVPENGQSMGRCAYRSAHFIGHYYFCND